MPDQTHEGATDSEKAVEAWQSFPGEENKVDFGDLTNKENPDAYPMSRDDFWDEVAVDITVRLPSGHSWTITEVRKGDHPSEADILDVLETVVESALFRQRSKVELEAM